MARANGMLMHARRPAAAAAAAAAALVVVLALAAAPAASAQLLPPLQPLPPLEPFAPFRPFAPLPGFAPMPGFAPFPTMPNVRGMDPMGGGASASATAGRAPGGASTTRTAGGSSTTTGFSSSSSSSSSSGSFGAAAGGAGAPGSAPGCTIIQQSQSGSQGFSSSAGASSCSTSQRVEVCRRSADSPSHTRAVATVDGQEATCCVVLTRTATRTPQLFCAAPTASAAYSRLPAAGVRVQLTPMCAASTAAGGSRTMGSVACTVAFEKLPAGFSYPAGYTPAKPLVLRRAKTAAAGGGSAASAAPPGFAPCNNARFQRMLQVVSRSLPGGGVVLTSKCE